MDEEFKKRHGVKSIRTIMGEKPPEKLYVTFDDDREYSIPIEGADSNAVLQQAKKLILKHSLIVKRKLKIDKIKKR